LLKCYFKKKLPQAEHTALGVHAVRAKSMNGTVTTTVFNGYSTHDKVSEEQTFEVSTADLTWPDTFISTSQNHQTKMNSTVRIVRLPACNDGA